MLTSMHMRTMLSSYRNVLRALRIMNDQNGLAMSKMRITLSTSGADGMDVMDACRCASGSRSCRASICMPCACCMCMLLGVVPGIDMLGTDLDVKLAISLHATNDTLRDRLVPINKTYPLHLLMEACSRYQRRCSDVRKGRGEEVEEEGETGEGKGGRRRITFEYVMLQVTQTCGRLLGSS